jgi:peroxiredoxin
MKHSFLLATALALTACKAAPDPGPTSPPTVNAAVSQTATAEAGRPAPDFALPDLDGKTVRLSDLRGKIVVLEWFNPECPFVKASHTKGSLNGLAKRYTDKGVVWLAVNSAAEGKQGFGAAKSLEGKKRFAMEHPVLLDPTGEVGHRYGATNTPHMYVIDTKGTLVYRGAIDNSPDGEGESPTGGKLVTYAADAIDATMAGSPVATKETPAYGCHVKY